MSLLLNDTLSQYLLRTSSIPSLTYPFAMQCSVRLDDLGVDQCLMGVFNSGSSGNYHALIFNGASGSNPVVARTRSSSSNGDASSSSGIGSVDWNVVTGLWVSDSERYVWLNGTAVGSNTDSRSVTGLDSLAIGRLNVSTPSTYMSGQVANVAIWSGLPAGGFTAAEVAQLGYGITPLLVRVDELVFFAPLPGATPNPAIDVIGSYDIQQFGAPTSGDSAPPTLHFVAPMVIPPPIGFIEKDVDQTVTASQTLVANIHGGYPESTVTPTQLAESNVVLGTASNTQEATQDLQDNTIQAAAANVQAATTGAETNVILPSISNEQEATQSATTNVTQASASSEQEAQQTLTDNVAQGSASNTLTVISNAGREINEEAFSNAPVLHSAVDNFLFYPEIEHTVTAEQEVSANIERNLDVEHIVYIESHGYRTIEGTASNTASASVEAARGESLTSTVTTTQTATGSTTSYAATAASATQTVTATIERNLSAGNTLTTSNSVHGFLQATPCELHQYTPQGGNLPSVVLSSNTTITLDCGVDSVTLRNPEFDNTDELNIVRALNRSRNGTVSTYRDSSWPKSQLKSFTVRNLARADALDLLDFQYNCLGKEVTYTDMEDREWVGAILNPQDGITAEGANCQYSVSFQFRGVLSSEKTW